MQNHLNRHLSMTIFIIPNITLILQVHFLSVNEISEVQSMKMYTVTYVQISAMLVP